MNARIQRMFSQLPARPGSYRCHLMWLSLAAAVVAPMMLLPCAHAQLTNLWSFTGGSDGMNPKAGLVEALDGTLYGTASQAGNNGNGTIFNITTAGALTPIWSFGSVSNDGGTPLAALVSDGVGNIYGTTSAGGSNGDGTFFTIMPGDIVLSLSSFSGADGSSPVAALTIGVDSNLYGTTLSGGSKSYGTVFSVAPDGSALTDLWSFTGGVDGGNPSGTLAQDANGNFYGTTPTGGVNNAGTFFTVSPYGNFLTLYSFATNNGVGIYPVAGLINGADGNFYGTTLAGGIFNAGTIFKITTNGVATVVWSFSGGSDGANPHAGLYQAGDGNLYGTTTAGGASSNGTLFVLATNGAFATLHAFTGGMDGGGVAAGVIEASDGNLYGTTENGGVFGVGTVFQYPLANQPLVPINVQPFPTNGAGVVSGSGSFPLGSSVFLWATPTNSNWHFNMWSDGSTENPHTITVTASTTNYTAFFYQSSSSWSVAYKKTFENPADVELLREYRDKVLKQNSQSSGYVAWMYERSDKLLALLMKNADLHKLAGSILNNHRGAIEKALNGQPAVIQNPRDIIAFCELVRRDDKGEIGLMADNIRSMILAGMKTGNPVLGVRFGSGAAAK